MKTKLLTLLREAEGYISGQELCERFGVSRTAVWMPLHPCCIWIMERMMVSG